MKHITKLNNFLKMYNERLVDRISLLRFTPLAGSYIYVHPDEFEINEKMLQIKYFNKMSLYKRSFNWWNTRGDLFSAINGIGICKILSLLNHSGKIVNY